MSAPKRIWAIPDMDDVPRRHWDCGVWREDRADALDVHGEPVIEYVRADIHAATLARAERAEAERVCAELDAAMADGKIRHALPTRFVSVPPDGGDVKTLEAVKATVEALERAEALLKEAVNQLSYVQERHPLGTTADILARIQEARHD